MEHRRRDIGAHRKTSGTRSLADATASEIDSLLEDMSDLAEQAGDWQGHLPFQVAVEYLDNEDFQRDYGSHVDGCRYCRDLIDALHPAESTLDELMRTRELNARSVSDPASAVTNAWTSLNALRDVVLEHKGGVSDGSLRVWTTAQKSLALAHASLNGPRSIAPLAWSGTVALCLDPYPTAGPAVDDDAFAITIEEIATHLLSSSFRVAHPDDLQPGGASERLFNLGCQYGRRMVAVDGPIAHSDTVHNAGFGVEAYCAWPVHIGVPIGVFEGDYEMASRFDTVNCLTLEGESYPYTYFSDDVRHEPRPQERIQGMAAFRTTIGQRSLARIAVGGATVPSDGPMPTMAQDALASLQGEQPLYVLGGFGGCARDIASALRLTGTRPTQSPLGFDEFVRFAGPQFLHNGLDSEENQSLADTADVEEAMRLVLRGLSRVAAQRARAA